MADMILYFDVQHAVDVHDWIIDNSGSRLDLAREVRRCWTWLERLPQV